MSRPAVLLIGVVALSFVACGGGGTDPSASTVEVVIEHSKFDPPSLEVEAGTTVKFVVKNDDPIDHEFLIGDEAAQDRHEIGTEPSHGERPGEISIPAEEEASTTFTFGDPGTIIYGCHLPGHYNFGMKGIITIVE